jgi:hypothetical protein
MAPIRKWNPIPFHTEEIVGQENAAEVAAGLVLKSVYFIMEPMPDDVYHFIVKPEAKRWLVFYKARNQGEDR